MGEEEIRQSKEHRAKLLKKEAHVIKKIRQAIIFETMGKLSQVISERDSSSNQSIISNYILSAMRSHSEIWDKLTRHTYFKNKCDTCFFFLVFPLPKEIYQEKILLQEMSEILLLCFLPGFLWFHDLHLGF